MSRAGQPLAAPRRAAAAWRGVLFAGAKELRVAERDLVEREGFPMAWLDVLAQLYDAPGNGLRMQDLEERSLFTRSGLTRLVDRIEAAGLVRREPVPGDRRGVRVVLTPEERRRHDQHAITRTTHWGIWHADPSYNKAQSNPHDIAVDVFETPVPGIAPARLPAAGSLSGLKVGAGFTAVGYGAQSVTVDHGPTFHYADIRYVATDELNALNPSWLRFSMNPARGNGGTCYGDSGGPNFLGAGATETNIVGGTTITGDNVCRATNVDCRLDTPSARAFLGPFVALP